MVTQTNTILKKVVLTAFRKKSDILSLQHWKLFKLQTQLSLKWILIDELEKALSKWSIECVKVACTNEDNPFLTTD